MGAFLYRKALIRSIIKNEKIIASFIIRQVGSRRNGRVEVFSAMRSIRLAEIIPVEKKSKIKMNPAG